MRFSGRGRRVNLTVLALRRVGRQGRPPGPLKDRIKFLIVQEKRFERLQMGRVAEQTGRSSRVRGRAQVERLLDIGSRLRHRQAAVTQSRQAARKRRQGRTGTIPQSDIRRHPRLELLDSENGPLLHRQFLRPLVQQPSLAEAFAMYRGVYVYRKSAWLLSEKTLYSPMSVALALN